MKYVHSEGGKGYKSKRTAIVLIAKRTGKGSKNGYF